MKNNKKGFTLVELLAVIAVLAILILLVIPNVMKLFNEAKQKSFETELKEIYKVAQQKWMMESLNKKEERVYARVKGLECSNELSLTGRTELDYVIKLDKKGKVILYFATDNTYEYTYSGPGLDISSIDGVIQISKKDTNRQIQMTCTTAKLVTPPPENEGDYLTTGSGGSEAKYLNTPIKKNQIEKITFTNSLAGHSPNGTDCFDVSKGRTGSVLAWSTDSDNNGLYELTIGSKGSQVFMSNGNYLFGNLINLKAIEGMEHLNTSQVTDMSYMFNGSNKLEEVDVSHFDTFNVVNMKGMFGGRNNGVDSMKIKRIIGLNNFDTSNVTDMSSMFFSCSNLTDLDVSNFNTSKVTDMEDMFNSCNSLTSLDVSNFNTSNVTNMNHLFNDCNSLTELDVSHFDTSKVTDMECMFRNCSSLTSLNVSNFNTSNVTNMEGMFYGASKIKVLNVRGFDTSKVTDMSYMFRDCSSLTSLNVSNFNTSKVTNMEGMFAYCKELTSLDVSNFDTTNVTKMGAYEVSGGYSGFGMFEGCKNLRIINLGKFNTSKVEYFDRIFADCSNLERIFINYENEFTIKSGAQSTNMFYGCTKLRGEYGTTYNSSHFDGSYAHIDDRSNPGYFSCYDCVL